MDQLIVAVVLEDVLQAGHGDQPHAPLPQIPADAPEHHPRLRLVLQKVEGQEHIVRAVREHRLLRLREPAGHLQTVFPGDLYQILLMFNAAGRHGKFRQDRQELSPAAAHLHKFLSLQMPRLDQMAVLSPAQLHHGGGEAARPDHIPVVVHRLAVKLHQAAGRALAQVQGDPLIRRHRLPVGDVLSGGRHMVQGH